MQQLSIKKFGLFREKPESSRQKGFGKPSASTQYLLYKNESLKIPGSKEDTEKAPNHEMNRRATKDNHPKISYSHSLKYLNYVRLIRSEDMALFDQRAAELLKAKARKRQAVPKLSDSIQAPGSTEDKPVELKFSLKQVKSAQRANMELLKKLQGNTYASAIPKQDLPLTQLLISKERRIIASPLGSGVFPPSSKQMRDEDMLKKIYTDGIASKKKQSDPISTPRDVKQTQGTNTPLPTFEKPSQMHLSQGQVLFQSGSVQEETWEDKFRFTKTHYKKLFKYIDVKPVFKL